MQCRYHKYRCCQDRSEEERERESCAKLSFLNPPAFPACPFLVGYPGNRADLAKLTPVFLPALPAIGTGIQIAMETGGDHDIGVGRMSCYPVDHRVGLDR